MFVLASYLFPDCILLEEGGSTAGSDVAEVLEESKAAEVREAFIWDGQVIDKIIWTLNDRWFRLEVSKSLLQTQQQWWLTLGSMLITSICQLPVYSISLSVKSMHDTGLTVVLVCDLSVGAQLFVSPVPIWQAEWRWPAGWFTLRGDATRQRRPFSFTRQHGGRRWGCSRGRQQVLLLSLQHYLPQPASRLNVHTHQHT